MKILDSCEIILDIIKEDVLKSHVINIDETPVKVLKEHGRSKSYLWMFKGHPAVNLLFLISIILHEQVMSLLNF
ncbi:MAG: transposase [Bacteroidetes bacterium]|nr:transposase [Bacteroidota bacterium]